MFQVTFAPQEEIQQELMGPFWELQYIVRFCASGILGSGFLREAICSSPATRMFYRFNKLGAKADVTLCPEVHRTEAEDYLVWLLTHLSDNIHHWDFGGRTISVELELFLKNNPAMYQYVSPWINRHVSLIGLLGEFLGQLEDVHPNDLAYASYFTEHSARLTHAFFEEHQPMYALLCMSDVEWTVLANRFLWFTEERFEYPFEQPPTIETVDKMRQAELYMDTFWESLIDHLENISPKWNGLPLRVQHLFRSRRLRRTKPWKNMTSPMAIESSSISSGSSSSDKNPTFRVDERSLKVFHTLLYEGRDLSRLESIGWDDFVYAMKFMGFAVEKLFGSSWFFRPTEEVLWRPEDIMVEEVPSVNGKMVLVGARVLGDHLKARFGWERSMFVLAVPESEASTSQVNVSGA